MSTRDKDTLPPPEHRGVDREFLPPMRERTRQRSLWEIFLLGWSHFIPSLPISDDPPRRRT